MGQAFCKLRRNPSKQTLKQYNAAAEDASFTSASLSTPTDAVSLELMDSTPTSRLKTGSEVLCKDYYCKLQMQSPHTTVRADIMAPIEQSMDKIPARLQTSNDAADNIETVAITEQVSDDTLAPRSISDEQAGSDCEKQPHTPAVPTSKLRSYLMYGGQAGGIPNTTSRYHESKELKAQVTPFAKRVERALEEEQAVAIY